MEIGNKNVRLRYLDEAYTTEHWLVRIYRYVEGEGEGGEMSGKEMSGEEGEMMGEEMSGERGDLRTLLPGSKTWTTEKSLLTS